MGNVFGVKSIDFASIIKDVLRQWWGILLFALSCALLTSTVSEIQYTPYYTTSATFVVKTQRANASIYADISSAADTASRFKAVLDSSVFKNEIAKVLEKRSYTASTMVEVLPETNLITLTVTDNSAMAAYKCIRAIMENYSRISDYVVKGVVLDVIQSPEIPQKAANSGHIYRNGFLGLMAGFFLALLYVAYFSYMKDTVKNPREAASKLAARLLGSIYHERQGVFNRKKKRVSMLTTNPMLSFRYVESCRLTMSRIRSQMDRHNAKVILVTSVAENEGKSTVAANLAVAFAQDRQRVLLIDADFRKPSLYKIFEIPKEEATNFVEVLRTGKGIQSIINKFTNYELHIILNSAATGTIDDVLANGMFKSIINFARSQFDYIILDTAPMGLVPDAEGIARFVDASVLVVRQDRVMARSINDAIDTLNNSGARVLGVVFNDMTSGSTAVMGGRIYGGGYGR